MPFQSKAQKGWMFANHPEMAKRWAAETPDMKHLPAHKKTHSLKSAMVDKLRHGK